MAKGNPVLTFRVSDETLSAIEEDIRRKQSRPRLVAMENVGTWLRDAVREKLAKGKRGRKNRKQMLTKRAIYDACQGLAEMEDAE